MDKIYVITDLGPGDGGKGGVVHSLSCMQDDDINVIIKRGGAQGSHGVCTSYKEKFNFSQWGCGTFNGIPTFCSEQMVLSPVGLANEATALQRTGIAHPYSLLSVDPLCLCATPYHKISSQIEELILRDHPRGTVGTGVGRAVRMYEKYGDTPSLQAKELSNRKIIEHKLKEQRSLYLDVYSHIHADMVLPEDVDLLNENLSLLHDSGYLPYCVDLFCEVGENLKLVELCTILAQYEGAAVVECSHGVLTDAEHGLKPHTSAIKTLPKHTNAMLKNAGYDGQIVNLGVHRAYEIRHGAGPMPTYDAEFTNEMLPGSHKDNNRWQGKVRAGALDMELLRYALVCCKETPLDGLCLTWFDEIIKHNRSWPICQQYQGCTGDDLATRLQGEVKPDIRTYYIESESGVELFNEVAEILQKYIDLPLKMLSIGPSELDKISPFYK